MQAKKLIVGLGNPGDKYMQTRHNVGFLVLDSLCSGEFKFEKKFNAEVCEQGEGVILMKPQTFMNLSGEAMKTFTDYYKITLENIWVVHDDIDIPFGEIRIREGGSSAGHKGVESAIKQLGIESFLRFRVGVKNENLNVIDTEDFVLQRFTKEEGEKLPQIINLCVNEIEELSKEGKVEPKTLKIE
jgi:PTH1 family peptidyl-tRNA hydrolase